MRGTRVSTAVGPWQKAWEQSVLPNAAHLRLARAQAGSLDIRSRLHEEGHLVFDLETSQDTATQVRLSLKQASPVLWKRRLESLCRDAPLVLRTLGERPDFAMVEALRGSGCSLLPESSDELRISCSRPTTVQPCPFSVSALVAAGWLIEEDPWILLSLRGLSRPTALYLLQAAELNGTSDRAGDTLADAGDQAGESGEGMDLASAAAAESPLKFWGDARALRQFDARLRLGPTSPPPGVTLGVPPVADKAARHLLGELLDRLYGLKRDS